MARIGDAGYIKRLVDLLQTRDPIKLPLEVDPTQVGITIAIPADQLLARAKRASPDAGSVAIKGIAAPGAGQDFVLTVPAGHIYMVRAVYALFTTSATVANRRVRLVVDDGAVGLYVCPAAVAQGASEGWDQSWAIGAPVISGASGSGDLASSRTLPLLLLAAGYRVRSAVANIQAGDAFTNVRWQVEDFEA